MSQNTASTLPYKDASLTPEQRADDLLGRMTLEEKLGQLNQVFTVPEEEHVIKKLVQDAQVGSRILATSWHAGAGKERATQHDVLHETQRIAVEETRLGIPLIYGRDIIHGHLTIFPIPLAQAASWDPALVEEAAAVAAKEAVADWVHWTFAPMLDIARDPRWGRVIEGAGEDPYLGQAMARAQVRGFQGPDMSAPDRVIACAKHFVGYGASEGGRDYNTTEISDNTLRNTYLPPFEAAVEAGVGTVMCAFHDVNGRPCSSNEYLLDTILRHEMGFDGFVISDWQSVEQTVNHGTSEDFRDAAIQCLTAGVDMEMVHTSYYGHLKSLIEEGVVSTALVDRAVRRILLAKFRVGLFERPYTPTGLAEKVHLLPEHRALSRTLAARSMVLLKNEGEILPLPKQGKTISLIGPMADAKRDLLGSWTLDGRAEDTVSILEAFKNVLPDLTVSPSFASTDTMLRNAAPADVVVLVVGEDFLRNGENCNVAEINLPAGQEELIRAVHGLGKKIVLVVCSGRPLVLTRVEPLVSAILWAWHPGTEGGNAVADLLFGDVNPSGKLPITFPRSTGQIPIYYNYKNTGRPVDDYYGTDSRYQDIQGAPMYRFGYGLSYTTYEYSDFTINTAEIPVDGSVTVSAKVANTGSRAGEEIAQCYIRDIVGTTARPVRELKGFTRVALQPGESQQVQFTLGPKELSMVGLDSKRKVEPGKFQVWIGSNSSTQLGGEFRVV